MPARLADRRARAVGGDQKLAAITSPSSESVASMRVAAAVDANRTAVRAKLDAVGLAPARRAPRPAPVVLDHMRERLAGRDLAAKVRNVGRITSCSLESVTTMSRIGCASPATSSQTPMVSNSRRAAAAIAEARASPARRGRAPDRRRSPGSFRRAPGAARSPAPARQSRRRRSAHRSAAGAIVRCNAGALCVHHGASISLLPPQGASMSAASEPALDPRTRTA